MNAWNIIYLIVPFEVKPSARIVSFRWRLLTVLFCCCFWILLWMLPSISRSFVNNSSPSNIQLYTYRERIIFASIKIFLYIHSIRLVAGCLASSNNLMCNVGWIYGVHGGWWSNLYFISYLYIIIGLKLKMNENFIPAVFSFNFLQIWNFERKKKSYTFICKKVLQWYKREKCSSLNDSNIMIRFIPSFASACLCCWLNWKKHDVQRKVVMDARCFLLQYEFHAHSQSYKQLFYIIQITQ